MINHLFHFYDCLAEKALTLDKVVEALGANMNEGFLEDEFDMLELLIIKAYGGNEGHYKHIHSTELFHNYRTYPEEFHKEELVDYIKLTIKENFTDEVECHFYIAES